MNTTQLLGLMLFAAMSDSDILHVVGKFVIFGLGALWWLIDFAIKNPDIKRYAQIVLVLLAVLWLCRMLLALNP